MKDSKFNHDQTIAALYPEGYEGDPRRALMKSPHATNRMFCQWCAQVRESSHIDGYLRCIKCDRAGPPEPNDPIAARGR